MFSDVYKISLRNLKKSKILIKKKNIQNIARDFFSICFQFNFSCGRFVACFFALSGTASTKMCKAILRLSSA